jgi:hypothetical protein
VFTIDPIKTFLRTQSPKRIAKMYRQQETVYQQPIADMTITRTKYAFNHVNIRAVPVFNRTKPIFTNGVLTSGNPHWYRDWCVDRWVERVRTFDSLGFPVYTQITYPVVAYATLQAESSDMIHTRDINETNLMIGFSNSEDFHATNGAPVLTVAEKPGTKEVDGTFPCKFSDTHLNITMYGTSAAKPVTVTAVFDTLNIWQDSNLKGSGMLFSAT